MASAFGSKFPGRPHPVLDREVLIGCANLFDYLDKRVIIVLQDGKTMIGMFRSFDQFNNLVLHQAVERIHVGKYYGDIPRGIFMVRGDTLQMIGEIDEEKEAKSHLKCIPVNLALSMQREAEEEKERREAKRIEVLKKCGVAYPLLREAGINDN